jgi:hypothetical protein
VRRSGTAPSTFWLSHDRLHSAEDGPWDRSNTGSDRGGSDHDGHWFDDACHRCDRELSRFRAAPFRLGMETLTSPHFSLSFAACSGIDGHSIPRRRMRDRAAAR